MITVYVKHYLNEEGRTYYSDKWFPYVQKIIASQPGFRGIETSKEHDDRECVNITVKFDDMETLAAWVENDDHKKVIDALDCYRTKGQRWFISDRDSVLAPALEQWEEAPLPKAAHRQCKM